MFRNVVAKSDLKITNFMTTLRNLCVFTKSTLTLQIQKQTISQTNKNQRKEKIMKATAITFAVAVAAFVFAGHAKAYNPYSPYWFPHKTAIVKDASVPPICKTAIVKDALR